MAIFCKRQTRLKLRRQESMMAGDELLSVDPFASLEVPAQLEASIARHRTHLVELVRTMKTAGVSDVQIEESVTVLVASYKAELMAAIKSMKGDGWR